VKGGRKNKERKKQRGGKKRGNCRSIHFLFAGGKKREKSERKGKKKREKGRLSMEPQTRHLFEKRDGREKGQGRLESPPVHAYGFFESREKRGGGGKKKGRGGGESSLATLPPRIKSSSLLPLLKLEGRKKTL